MCHSCLRKATYDGAWIRQELLDSRANDRQLGGKSGMPGFHLVPNEPKIGAQRPADMVALRPFRTHGTAFDATKLLEVAMIGLNRPNLARGGRALGHGHQRVAGRPIFRVTVGGVDPKHQDEAIAFEMYAGARFANVTRSQGSIARSVRIHQAIVFQARQPLPTERANQFQVFQRAVPAIKTHVAWGKAAVLGDFEHCPEVIVLRVPVVGRIKQAIIAWDGVRVVTPYQGHQQ